MNKLNNDIRRKKKRAIALKLLKKREENKEQKPATFKSVFENNLSKIRELIHTNSNTSYNFSGGGSPILIRKSSKISQKKKNSLTRHRSITKENMKKNKSFNMGSPSPDYSQEEESISVRKLEREKKGFLKTSFL